jgi:Tol biopolymer transport system component
MALVRSSLHFRFELAGLLTESTAGTVYVAKECDTGKPCCLHFVGWRYSSRDQRQRFLYEVRQASTLVHPSLLAIREVIEGDDGVLVVYEYEPYQTLASLLWLGQLSVRQALAYATQIADVLELTSKQGILHGYVDPTSILITKSGLAKIFGFGTARLRAIEDAAQFASGDLSEEAAHALERTQLRRFAYQAPECLQGIAADSRSEVFSLGCVLYEMLSGKRAFARKSSALTARAVMEQFPKAINEVVTDVPRDVTRIVGRCLRKDPGRRYQHLLDLKIDLQNVRDELEFAGIISQLETNRRRWHLWLPASVVVVWACVYLGIPRYLLQTIAPRGVSTSSLEQVTTGNTLSTDPFVSADGTTLVFASDREEGNLDLYVQRLGEEPLRLTSDAADEREPVLSPDGRTIAFRSDRLAGGIYTVPVDGSAAPRWIANQGRRPRYSPDGQWIAFWARNLRSDNLGSIYVMPASGGTPRRLAEEFHTALCPIWSPDGRHLLFLGAKGQRDWLEFWAVPVDGGEVQNVGAYRVVRRRFIQNPIPDAWVNDTLYFTGTANGKTGLWRISLSPETLRVQSDLVPLFQDSEHDGYASVTADGRVFFSRMADTIQLWRAPVDANRGVLSGKPSRLLANDGITIRPSFSKDGNLLAYTSNKDGMENVWLRDMTTGKEERITHNQHAFFTPSGILSQDGQWLAFTVYEMGRTVIFYRSTTTGETTRLCDSCETPRDWTADASHLLYVRSARNYAIGMVERGTGANTVLVQSDRFPLLAPRLSPDGRWVAFHALVGPDMRKIFTQAIRGTSSAKQREWVPITTEQILDRGAQWSPDGSLLYFLSERDGRRNIYAQAVHPTTKQPLGEPFVVYAEKSTQRSLLNVPRGLAELAIVNGNLVFTMGEYTGNIFVARFAD